MIVGGSATMRKRSSLGVDERGKSYLGAARRFELTLWACDQRCNTHELGVLTIGGLQACESERRMLTARPVGPRATAFTGRECEAAVLVGDPMEAAMLAKDRRAMLGGAGSEMQVLTAHVLRCNFGPAETKLSEVCTSEAPAPGSKTARRLRASQPRSVERPGSERQLRL